MPCFVMTVASVKGGTSKTTTVLLLARLLTAAGKKVLVADADPQNATTFACLGDSDDETKSIAKAFGNRDVLGNIVKSRFGFDLIRSSLDIIDYTATISNRRLSEIFESQSVRDHYDFILIDTAPTYDRVVAACLAVADRIALPIEPMSFSVKGANATFRRGMLYDNIPRERFFPFFTRFKGRFNVSGESTKISAIVASEEIFGDLIARNYIIERQLISDAIDRDVKITKSQDKKAVFDAFCDLACEIFSVSPDYFSSVVSF